MKRRQFSKQLSIGTLATMASTGLWSNTSAKKKHIKPKRLKKGDIIGLITPGSYIDDESLEKAVGNLESMGFQVKMGQHIRAERGFTAGTDGERLADLHSMFADGEVAGIWCARGGYGCTRLLPMMDYKLIRKNPKVLVGYSDITALHSAIFKETGLISFHGPVGASDFTDYNKAQLEALLMHPESNHVINMAPQDPERTDTAFTSEILHAGIAQGELVGGNLSLLAAMAGTSYLPDLKDKLVFIEDIGEKPYRLDRMLTQMRQATNLKQAAGIVLGVFADCQPDEDDRSLTLMETLRDRLGDLKVPTIYGFSFGHIKDQCTFPVGISAKLDTLQQTVTVLEAGVS